MALSTENYIWCPGLDAEMTNVSKIFIDGLKLFKTCFEGGSMGLEGFSPRAKIYVLCHGHGIVPLFKTKKGNWTADQLAQMLVESGLSREQREIELLVCHAGESVNTIAKAAKFMELMSQGTALKIKMNEEELKIKDKKIDPVAAALSVKELEKLTKKFDEISAKYEKLKVKTTKPRFFEKTKKEQEIESESEPLSFPLAVQLSQALRRRGYSHFRIISYRAAVAQYCQNNSVCLDLTGKGRAWGIPVNSLDYSKNPKKPYSDEYRVVWM